MANATAAQAYAAIQAMETQMKVTDEAGYSLKVPVEEAKQYIVDNTVGVDTKEEAYVGIQLAASNATAIDEDFENGLYMIYKGEGYGQEPQPGTNILFLLNNGTYVSSLAI